MPNHMHGIIALLPHENPVGAPLAGAQNMGAQNGANRQAGAIRAGASPAPTNTKNTNDQNTNAEPRISNGRRVTLGDIVGAYKSLVAMDCLKIDKSSQQTMGRLWQRNYWEHIIRNEQELSRIQHYIESNPINWEFDKLNANCGHPILQP